MTITEWLKNWQRNPYTTGLALLAQNGGSAAMLARLQHETIANRRLLSVELRKATNNKMPKVLNIEDAPPATATRGVLQIKKKRRASGGCCN